MAAASDLMPKRIEQVFEQPKVFEMIKAIGEGPVKTQIEFELVKLASLMSVGGNLNKAQVLFVAEQLIQLYPNESIADFKLCFQRGAIGLYGDIQRLDGITIGGWMCQYLDEKYQILEDQLMKEKETYHTVAPTPAVSSDKDWLKIWKEAVDKVDNERPASRNLDYLKGLSEKEIKEQGQEKPQRSVHNYPSTPLEQRRAHELHIQWVRENYDPQSGKPKEGWISEDEFLKQQSI